MSTSLPRRDVLASLLLAPLVSGSTPARAEGATLHALLARRRMIRRFRREPVDDDDVRRILAAATRAPSAGNLQPWAFVVVRDPAVRRELGAAAFGQTWLAEAPVAIVPCADPSIARPRYRERAERYAVIDTAFASLLLMLRVTELGLGACFVGAFEDERVRRAIAAPSHVQPLAVVPVGHPAETPRAMPRRPQAEVVHDGRWGR